MSQVIKVKANEAGQYPVRLFGTDYLIEPVDDARSETTTQNKKRKASSKVDTSPERVGQPVNDLETPSEPQS